MTQSTHHPLYQLFLAQLRAAREAAETTQWTIADRLGNHQVFVSKLERGQRRMDVIDLYEYCRAAKIDFSGFVLELERVLDKQPARMKTGKLSVGKPGRKTVRHGVGK